MVVEDFLSFFEWLLPGPQHTGSVQIGALGVFVLLVPLLTILVTLLCYAFMAKRYGASEGFYIVARTIANGCTDIVQTSPRRVFAMARLAVHEAIRRRVLIAFAIFLLVLLFAGWFLDVENDNPARLYLSFVLTATTYLVLVLSLFLSTFSLPNDIKHRTIYTIVTKPVRCSEIILGRILGFSLIGTVLIAMMCLISYVFVTRGVDHEHTVEISTVTELPKTKTQAGGWKGETTKDAYHFHKFTLGPDGKGKTDTVKGHWHYVERISETEYIVGPPQDLLLARKPVYGKLKFRSRGGKIIDRGINVGNEWSYRSYIEGGSPSAAIYTFSDINPNDYPDGLPLELNLRVFRTYKGDIESGILGTIELRNPDPDKPVKSEPRPFTAKEFTIDQQQIPRKMKILDRRGKLQDSDLFADLVNDKGEVEIWIQCAQTAQYFGMAQGDVYIRAEDSSFLLNFVKAYVGIWLQMIIVTCFGVMFSALLSGSVAMLATFGSLVMGFFGEFIAGIATGSIDGGGPMESLLRLVTQKNISLDLDPGIATTIMISLDKALMIFMYGVAQILPDYGQFSTTPHVAYGFAISNDLLARHCVITLVYVMAASIIGYFFLKTREIAA